jgi:hypothetical protein
MIEYILSDFRVDSIGEKLWDAYADIDYGHAVPEKGYKGYKTFLEDVSGAELVEGSSPNRFTLYFKNETDYTWFLLKWG